jgi:hypothetical protein
MVRRTALLVAALVALASLPLGAGATARGASPLSAPSTLALARPVPAGGENAVQAVSPTPRDRGGDPGGGDQDARREEKKPKQEPCPEELWTIPIQIEGLACILLFPKKEEPEEPAPPEDPRRR